MVLSISRANKERSRTLQVPLQGMNGAKSRTRPLSGSQGNRARAKTLTTPLATPSEERIGFDWSSSAAAPGLAKHWETLPRELKSRVLLFLPPKDRVRCGRVNRDLRALVQDGALWQVLDTETFHSKIPAVQLRKMIELAAPFVQHLNLRGCTQLKDDISFTLGNLQTVNFEGCRFLTGPSLVNLISRNEKLKALDVNGLHAADNNVLESIVQHCPGLEILNLSYCAKVESIHLSRALQHLTSLRDLRIAECPIDLPVLRAIHALKKLERLCLSGCRTLKDLDMRTLIYDDAIFGVHMPECTVKMANLTHLDLSHTFLTDQCVQYMIGTLPQLEKLELAGAISLTDEGLVRLLPHVPKLTHIDFEDCIIGDSTLTALAANCPALRHVQLSHCSNITDVGVLHLVDSVGGLQHLDLDNTKITNSVLAGLAAKPCSMRLSLYDCPNITWTGVLSLLTSNSTRPKYLKKLKTFYGWQRPVDGHTRAVLKGDSQSAREIEKAWTQYMMQSSEQVMRGEVGQSRFLGLDVDEQGARIVGRETRQRRACLIM